MKGELKLLENLFLVMLIILDIYLLNYNISTNEYNVTKKNNSTANYMTLEELKGNEPNTEISILEHYETEDKDYVSGFYNHDSRVIILNKEDFNKWNDIAVHEFVHAYLNRRNQKRINICGVQADYGMGLEEGAASIIQKVDSIKDIDNFDVDSYIGQSFIFKQLNILI